MTREEAIHFAECLKNNWTINFADMEEFCDMAIEALSEPSGDLISRQDVLAQSCGFFGHEVVFMNRIEKLPSARPTGEWIYTNNPLRICDEWRCSECGNITFWETNYCDRCGADMRGGDGE